MARADPLEDLETVLAFGMNISTCCELIGSSIESLALRTDIDHTILIGYEVGVGKLSETIIEAVCSEFRLKKLDLLHNYGTEDRRKRELERLLANEGHLTASRLVNDGVIPKKLPKVVAAPTTVPEKQPDPPPVTTAEEEIQTTDAEEEIMADQGNAAVLAAEEIEVSWEDNDFIGKTADGALFNLRDKNMRADLIGRIRAAVAGSDETFSSLNQRAKLGKNASWWRDVELGRARICGTEVESIADVLGVSVYGLLSGNGTITPKTAEELAAPPADEVATPQPPPVTAPEAAPPADEAPPATSEQEYFRRLLFSANTEPAAGVKVGQLLELARDQEGVDWMSSYLDLTAEGRRLKTTIEEMRACVSGHEKPIRALFVAAITGACMD